MALWDRDRGRQLRRKDNIGLEDDHFSRWYQRACNPEWPTRVAASNSTRSAPSSAFLRTSTTRFFFISFFRPFPIPPLLSPILMRIMFIPRTFYQEYPRVCRDVGACPRAWGARLLRRKLEKLESVLYHDKRVFLLFLRPIRLPFHPPSPCIHSFVFPSSLPSIRLPSILLSLPSCCWECASPLAKLNHFHSWTHTSRTELTRRSRASLYVISAHQH